MTVRENLDKGAYRRGRARRSDNRARVFAIFPRLAGSKASVSTLSGGEQQMLAIGRGLMAEPELLILDEPSLGLSPLLVEELFALIKAIHAQDIAILLIEQNVVQSLEVAQRAYILDNGRASCWGAAADIGNNPELKRLSRTMIAFVPSTGCTRKPIVVAPGIYDPFTALVATQAGFTTLYVSGAAIAYTRLGRPDIGLVSETEVASTVALIRDRVDAHLIVDADTGFGNALNVQCTVQDLERAGRQCDPARGSGFSQALRWLAISTARPCLVAVALIMRQDSAALDARRSDEAR